MTYDDILDIGMGNPSREIVLDTGLHPVSELPWAMCTNADASVILRGDLWNLPFPLELHRRILVDLFLVINKHEFAVWDTLWPDGPDDPCPCASGKLYKDCHVQPPDSWSWILFQADPERRFAQALRMSQEQFKSHPLHDWAIAHWL